MVDDAEYQFEERDYACELSKKHGLFRETERLEKQLKEAEEALKDFCEDCTLSKCGGCDEDCAGWKAKEYLERYGVK